VGLHTAECFEAYQTKSKLWYHILLRVFGTRTSHQTGMQQKWFILPCFLSYSAMHSKNHGN
jgi:hypothetical protein